MSRLLLAACLISFTVNAQVEHSRGKSPYTYYPGFYMDIASYPTGKAGLTRVDVFLKMPYDNIQFVKSPDGFNAKYSVTLTFYDKDKKNIVFERLWNEKITTADFEQAVSKKNFNYSYRSFELEPEKYMIRCEVVDSDSKKNYVVEALTNVADYNKEVEISDIIFVIGKIRSGSETKLIPNVANIITSRDSALSVFYEIYSNKNQSLSIEYILKDKNNNAVFNEVKDIELKEGVNQIDHTLSNIAFTLGEYNLIAQVRNEDWDIIDGTSKKILSQIYGYPASITDLGKAIDQMMYIANSNEIDYIKLGGNYNEQLDRFEKFWKAKDPSPNTEENAVLNEYYRRIEYANANFKHYFEGWRTDMGMVYIVLGPPSNVERHPFEYSSKPYEIWDYYDINKRFVFVDQTGFGDYRLLDQQYGDWYRYRP